MAFDSSRGVTVLFGGQTASGDLDGQTWEWDGSEWLLKNPATAPSPRFASAMAFDVKRGVVVLFGGTIGNNSETNNETWEWDGVNWTQKTPATSPSLRAFHAMAFDSARGVTVLFGGIDDQSVLVANETWEWDGTNWLNRNPMAAPPPLAAHAMAYDITRGETVLFSGLLSPGSPLTLSSATWIWNGTEWAQRLAATAPPARYLHASSFDSGRGRTLIFGGVISAAPDVIGDLWEWDGSTWTQAHPGAQPSARFAHTMAYDSVRHFTVLFGGSDGNALNDETWELKLPTILVNEQPVEQSVMVGQAATFSVDAASESIVLSFAWRRNGVPLVDGGSISGSSTPTLTIDPVNISDGGDYDCEISHTCQKVISQAASLVIADVPAAAQAPCGVCGGGIATVMPLSLVALIGFWRKGKISR